MAEFRPKIVETSGDYEERVVNLNELTSMIPELLVLAEKKDAAAAAFAAGIDAAVYRSGAHKPAIRKLVVALHKDKAKAMHVDATEVADLIEAVAPDAID